MPDSSPGLPAVRAVTISLSALSPCRTRFLAPESVQPEPSFFATVETWAKS
ncbi:hypothetical protein D9M68_907060 [compost metagenome]